MQGPFQLLQGQRFRWFVTLTFNKPQNFDDIRVSVVCHKLEQISETLYHILLKGLSSLFHVQQGDQGGPLMCRNTNGKWEQVGVSILAKNRERVSNFARVVFAKVSFYRDLIFDVRGKSG